MTTLRNRLNNPKTLVFLGTLMLAIASICRFLTPRFRPDYVDGVTGLLYGMSFAFLLMSVIRKNRRPASAAEDGPCSRP